MLSVTWFTATTLWRILSTLSIRSLAWMAWNERESLVKLRPAYTIPDRHQCTSRGFGHWYQSWNSSSPPWNLIIPSLAQAPVKWFHFFYGKNLIFGGWCIVDVKEISKDQAWATTTYTAINIPGWTCADCRCYWGKNVCCFWDEDGLCRSDHDRQFAGSTHQGGLKWSTSFCGVTLATCLAWLVIFCLAILTSLHRLCNGEQEIPVHLRPGL